MILTLSKTLDGDNVINKVLTNSVNLNINLKRDVDIINPVLILMLVAGVDYRDYNYCTISELRRSYFIRSVEVLNERVFSLVCECDYLETYKADILASKAKVMRKIESGDYGETELNFTGEVEITNHESNITLEPFDNSLLTVIRWA